MQSLREQQGEIKKAFLSEQCKEIEEDNRLGKTRDFFFFFQENWRYQENISDKDEHSKGPN